MRFINNVSKQLQTWLTALTLILYPTVLKYCRQNKYAKTQFVKSKILLLLRKVLYNIKRHAVRARMNDKEQQRLPKSSSNDLNT